MRPLTVQAGGYVSRDVGLSDDFVIKTIDDSGEEVLFHLEPREWLEEWKVVSEANLPIGATYSRTLLVCGEMFRVHIFSDSNANRRYRFTVFDVPSRTDRMITLSEAEVALLVGKIRKGLAR